MGYVLCGRNELRPIPSATLAPVLSAAEAAKRTYTILGRQSLLTGDWAVVPSGQEANYNSFKVTVEMK